ncbi:MAG: metallophosphoesterase [Deltaproteobacteria bacterium]|nr:metallophosphoesterase [Deltaproteobacteria bacterium]
MRTILFGDIHGCFDELRELLDRLSPTADDILVSVGDLVDRGPDPSAVIDFFRQRPGAVAVCGNHERKHIRGILSYSQLVAREQMGERYDEQVAWMATLPYHYETDEVRVVHWGLYPGVPLEEVPEDVRAGTTSGDGRLRERFGDTPWYAHYTDAKPVVFGHAVVGSEPLIIDDRIFGIDTGACHGQRLTALVLPERRIVSVPAREDHWARMRRAWQGPVLRRTPWPTMTFEQIAKKARSLRDPELEDGVLTRVTTWAEAVRALVPQLAAALDHETARLLEVAGEADFGRVAAAHPAASWLLRLRTGKLSRDHLACTTPAQVFALADALALSPEVDRAPLG